MFGCWNKLGCPSPPENPSDLSRVVDILDKETKDSQFYLVSGDNYYPEKLKDQGKKIFSYGNLVSGFDCLKKLNPERKKPIYVSMGNHDLEYSGTMIDDKSKKPLHNNCSITEIQRQYLETNSEFIIAYEPIITDHTAIIFINSTLYTDKSREASECFKVMFKPIVVDVDVFGFEVGRIQSQLKMLLKNPSLKNIVVVGHEPIVSRKEKKKKSVIVLNESGLDLLYGIYSKFPTQNKYYLCADVHNYQEATINLSVGAAEAGAAEAGAAEAGAAEAGASKISITQLVVGTGGAKLDICFNREDLDPEIKELNVEKNVGKFNIESKTKECKSQHGFITLQDNGEDHTLTSIFIPVPVMSGGRKKTKRRKPKRRKRKYTKKNK